MEYNKEQLVVIPVQQLIEIVGSVIDSKMEFWLNKKRAEEAQEKRDEEVMLTINECIAKYKVSRSTIYNKTKNGEIPCSRIGAKILISKQTSRKQSRTVRNGTLSGFAKMQVRFFYAFFHLKRPDFMQFG